MITHKRKEIFVSKNYSPKTYEVYFIKSCVTTDRGRIMESVVYFGDLKPPGCLRFLGEKGRIKIPIRTKHKLIDAFKRHAFEVAGLIAEAAERGLGSSILLGLCRLVKSAEGGEVYSKIHKLTGMRKGRFFSILTIQKN